MDEWIDAVSKSRVGVPASDPDWSRRRLGILMIAIALIAPFYGYFVWDQLWKAELRALERKAEMEGKALSAQMRANEIAIGNRFREARDVAAVRDLQRRVMAVRVVGAIDGNPAVVIVDHLPPEGAAEAADVICAQAGHWLRRATRGSTLRVQRDRGNQPALDAGVVVCS